MTLTSGSVPPLPTGEYYLGVQNTGANPVTFSIVVNFDITPLTNMVPYSSTYRQRLCRAITNITSRATPLR